MRIRRLLKSMIAVAAAAVLSSCYYDSYYGSYGSGYGVTGVSASFVSTGSSYWYYDPVVRCYYDRRRSAYYDPYLYGYYPRGYRPRPIVNCPHPYGWRGKGHAPVPHAIKDRTLNHRYDRIAQLKGRNYDWADRAYVRNEVRDNRRQATPVIANNNGSFNRSQSSRPQAQGSGRRSQQAMTIPSMPNQRSRPSSSQGQQATLADAARARNAALRSQAVQRQAATRQRAANAQAQAQAQRAANMRSANARAQQAASARASQSAAQPSQRQRVENARQRARAN